MATDKFIPQRLSDAPPRILQIAEALSDLLVDTSIRALFDLYPDVDKTDPSWRDFLVGSLEMAVHKATQH